MADAGRPGAHALPDRCSLLEQALQIFQQPLHRLLIGSRWLMDLHLRGCVGLLIVGLTEREAIG